MGIKLATGPVTWGVDFADSPGNPGGGTDNDAATTDRVAAAFVKHFGGHALKFDRQTVSEDFSDGHPDPGHGRPGLARATLAI